MNEIQKKKRIVVQAKSRKLALCRGKACSLKKKKVMKEKILEAFRNLGFKLEEAEGLGYSFTYERLNLLYMYNKDDEDFLNIALPGIIEVEEDNRPQISAVLEKINSTLKYVKAYILGSSVWLFYERELIEQQQAEGQSIGDEYLMEVISRMILHLESGLVFAHKAMAEIDETMAGDSSDDDGIKTEEDEGNN